MARAMLLFLLASLFVPANGAGPRDPYAEPRRLMIAEIAAMARATAAETARPAIAAEVLAAMEKVPRHRFVPAPLRAYAYENRPQPIGSGQTISQPYIVALMTDLLAPRRDHRVLEVGTGSGYQAAVLAELAGTVYTIEIVESLGREAARTLAELGYNNVRTRIGDGYQGWPEEAPFDGIMVTAAASDVPQPLIGQLKPGGRLVIPVGGRFGGQDLLIVEKRPDGKTTTRRSVAVRFVPLTRGAPR
ncbi:MAG: protein-L-isoaspartate O-methyltransferase [Betaproteobacteria bacterium RIFCSPLOWO2_02_FULL_65_24]|nr:MAG: protein-L-isoaspartate O-methyltransferase [Betaproteobacteria bacterium RIFCSPLOWO2_02_FULL_65_24]